MPPTGCARRCGSTCSNSRSTAPTSRRPAARDSDRAIIERTIAAARRRWQGTDADIFDFLRDALTLDLIGDGLPYSRPRVRKFALKMQQFTGPMAAKSLEDTAFYRYHALLGAERGRRRSDPAGAVGRRFSRRAWRSGAKQWPHGLTATATHDTKRGEDARMRILALSEMPELWAEHVAEWQRLNAALRRIRRTEAAQPESAAHEYMLYQALVGAWPLEPIDDGFVQRIEDYAIKAAREGKLETSWLNPNEDYEQGLRDLCAPFSTATAPADFSICLRASRAARRCSAR